MMMFFAIFGIINAALLGVSAILFGIVCYKLKRRGHKPLDVIKHVYELGANYAEELFDAAEE